MKYYVTIYIDELFERELYKDINLSVLLEENRWDKLKKQLDFTHAFLGLTRKHPDELDSMTFERETDKQIWDFKLGEMIYLREEIKWYEKFENVEFNDGFYGFGTGTDSFINTAGKVFENNHYIMDNNTQTNSYEIKKLRSKQTFSPYNRCTLELSQEQYEFLLNEIQKDIKATKDIRPNTQEAIKQDFNYHITNSNCVHWVQKKLRMIGVNIFEQFYIPGSLMDIFDSIRKTHNIFLKFQKIDSNLESIFGAKTFIKWVNEMVGNKYMKCTLNNKKDKKNNNILVMPLNCTIEEQEQIYTYWARRKETIKIYERLAEYLQSLSNKAEKLEGRFIFIYVSNNQGFMLDPLNNYKPQQIDELDLKIPANNFSATKFYPFIFIPKDKILSKILYHKYNYDKVSESYQNTANEFYFNVLAGIQSNKYWSESYHKLLKKNKQVVANV